MSSLYNNPTLKNFRKELRNKPTDAEHYFWQRIRKSQLKDYKFIRQYSVGSYILDFYCPKARLAIELDGSQHLEKEVYDEKRTLFLQSKGIRVLRFWNHQVLQDIDVVLEVLWKELEIHNTP